MQPSHFVASPSADPSGRRVQLSPARLYLAASAPKPSHVDGAWWPRSRNLVAQLPTLLEAVRDRTGDVALVGYHRDGWDRAADYVQLADKTIWLEGFTEDQPHTVIVIGESGRRLTLMVVAPETAEDIALEELVAQSRARPAAVATVGPQDPPWLDELASRLASMEGVSSEQRTRTIGAWVREAAAQFVDSPVQAYVQILVEHIVRDQITASPSHSLSRL